MAFSTLAGAEMQPVKVLSAIMNREIPAMVTVPKDYRVTDGPRPVLYLLHGAGDDERTWCDRTPVQEMADTYGVIIVTPGVGTSWYFDSPEDKNSQFETFVASELVKFVDAHYRTVPKREGRALAGNSMGGHGAMFLAIRHKDVFSATAPMSGGMDIRAADPRVGAFPENWDIKKRLGSIQAHPERWNELTVINQVDSLKNGELAISIDCGTEDFFLAVNRQLHAKLTAMGIVHAYAEYPGQHGWDYWRLALPRQMAFLARHLPGALAPASAPKPGDADYPTRIANPRHDQKVAAVRTGSYDLVLIGDSITQTVGEMDGEWSSLKAVWDKHYAPRHAINLGYAGYRTENILWNLQDGEVDFTNSPKVVMLLIGTNNTDDQHYKTVHTAEQVFAGTKAIVELIRQRHPTTKILVLRIFPCGGPGSQTSYHRQYNRSAKGVEACGRAGELTAQLADGEHVFWLDIGYVFLRADGTINTDLMPDLIHPNAAGAEAWAQAVEPTLAQLVGDKPIVDPQPNTAVVPVPKLENDSYDWYARHADVLRVKNAINPEAVLIGDSITHFWGGEPKANHVNGPKAWQFVFGNYRTLNLGFGWDRTQNVLWRLDHGELDGLHPRVVVLHIGTNNTSGTGNARQNTPVEIADGIREILIRLRSKVPSAQIILMAVFPREEKPDHPRRAQIAAINKLLAELAKTSGVTFLDIGTKLLQPDGTISRQVMSDFCHPTEKGYQVWADALMPLIGGHP